jgi:hypothetical protein
LRSCVSGDGGILFIRYKRSVGIAMSPTRNGRKTRKNLVERLSFIVFFIFEMIFYLYAFVFFIF